MKRIPDHARVLDELAKAHPQAVEAYLGTRPDVRASVDVRAQRSILGDDGVIYIDGVLVPDDYVAYDDEIVTSPAMVRSAYAALNGAPAVVEVNSPGGYISAGSGIYTIIHSYRNATLARVIFAASAAQFFTMAADEIEISPAGRIMIHRAWAASLIAGNADVHLETGTKNYNALDSADRMLVNIISERTDNSAERVREWIQAETFFTADEAIEHGFAVRSIGRGNAATDPDSTSGMASQVEPRAVPAQSKIDAFRDWSRQTLNQNGGQTHV